MRRLLGLADGEPIPPSDVRMGTTLATNALLERRGAPCALAITRGFRDLLEIGTQARPRLFDLEIRRPERLYREVLEVDARADASGQTLARPDPEALAAALDVIRQRGIDSLAVVVLHSYRAPGLENEIAAVAERIGFGHVSTSSEVAAELGLLSRGDTAVVDAYLTPLIRDYVRELADELPGSAVRLMQSSGGLTDATRFRGRNAILSGPAAGVVAAARIAEQTRLDRIVGFDMGGTSTDVSRYEGELDRVYESEIAGVRLRAPMMAIHTVAAGGGSLCRYRGFRLTVGPESAGAEPGPLCYGRPEARELTLTDVNLALGRVAEDRFPFPLDRERVAGTLAELARKVGEGAGSLSPEAVAEGFLEVANRGMAEAIRQVSVAQGRDVRGYALAVFGGAGGQHACAVASRLGIRTLLFHRLGGVLSAYGMGLADVSWHGEADAGRRPLADGLDLEPLMSPLEERGRSALIADGCAREALVVLRRVDLRYSGTERSLTVEALPGADAGTLVRSFEAAHEQLFGYLRPDAGIEVVTARVEVVAPGVRLRPPATNAPEQRPAPSPLRHAKVWMAGQESHTHSVNHLAFISTADGSYQALKSFDWREPLGAAFSPDGRYVAYDFPPEQDSPNRDLFVVSEDGTFEAPVVDGPGIDRLLDWHPDGSILFHSDRAGSPGVWRLPMTDGRPGGAPELLRADTWGVEPLGSTPGRFYYGIEVNPPRLYSATVDLEAGRLVSTPVPIVEPARFQVQGWDWSPDGNYLAFSAAAPSTAGSVLGTSGSAVGITTSDSDSFIGITTSDGTIVQVLPVDLEATGLLRWDADGGSVVLFTVDSKARSGLYRVDLESGSVESILGADEVERTLRGYFALSPDGGTLYFTVLDERLGPDGWLALVSRDLQSGEERDLGVVSWPGRIALSPDGSEIAAVVRDPEGSGASIGTIPVGGGPATPLHRPWGADGPAGWPDGAYPVDLAWTADGRSILFFSQLPGADSGKETTLWRGALDGGPVEEVRLIDEVDARTLRLHPDGRRIAFMAGDARGEVWVMEGLGGPGTSAPDSPGSR